MASWKNGTADRSKGWGEEEADDAASGTGLSKSSPMMFDGIHGKSVSSGVQGLAGNLELLDGETAELHECQFLACMILSRVSDSLKAEQVCDGFLSVTKAADSRTSGSNEAVIDLALFPDQPQLGNDR